jgi:hypothetical protein
MVHSARSRLSTRSVEVGGAVEAEPVDQFDADSEHRLCTPEATRFLISRTPSCGSSQSAGYGCRIGYSYLSQNDATAALESRLTSAQRLPALSALLDGDLLWDRPARQLVFMVDSWIEGTGYGRRLHTCTDRRVTEDSDLARGFSHGAKTAEPELVAAAADEVLDIIAACISAVDDSAAAAAVTAALHSGLTESPARKPMFTILRARQLARLAGR